jgi:hypothetical protein
VGGGLYVYSTGALTLQVSQNEAGNLGVFSNKAQFAANDVYCSPSAASQIGLPNVKDMVLKDYENHVIGKAEDWYEDYPDGDTKYDERYKIEGAAQTIVRRYDENRTEGNVSFQVGEKGKTVDGYVCLTLGYSYTRINLTVTKTVAGLAEGETSDQVFQFTATITGAIKQSEVDSYAAENETAVYDRIFLDPSYKVVDSGEDEDHNNALATATVTFSLRAGESIVLRGVPVNAKVEITEDNYSGYIPEYNWNKEEIYGVGDKITIANVGDQYSTVNFTNTLTTGYELPKTGGEGVERIQRSGVVLLTAAMLGWVWYGGRRRRRARKVAGAR